MLILVRLVDDCDFKYDGKPLEQERKMPQGNKTDTQVSTASTYFWYFCWDRDSMHRVRLMYTSRCCLATTVLRAAAHTAWRHAAFDLCKFLAV